MKKLLVMIGLISTLSYAQEEMEPTINQSARNEISVDLLGALLEYPSITYERIGDSGFGYGVKVGFDIGDDDDDLWNRNYDISPFARLYFLSTGTETYFGRRFFVEGSISAIGEESYDDYSYNGGKADTDLALGLGIGLGYKYVNQANWLATISAGVSRTFGDSENFYGNFQIGIGKRF